LPEVFGTAGFELPLMIGDGQHRTAGGLPVGSIAGNALHEQIEIAFRWGVFDPELNPVRTKDPLDSARLGQFRAVLGPGGNELFDRSAAPLCLIIGICVAAHPRQQP
jgi:hypothetical protein